jgi:N-acetylmuramoyl-L-alanine amidase
MSGAPTGVDPLVTAVTGGGMEAIRPGDRGPAVAEIRSALRTLGHLNGVHRTPDPPLDGFADADEYDAACDVAVRAFQQQRGLIVDGLVGPATYRALTEARWQLGDRVLTHTVTHPMVGDDVAALQGRLLEMGYDAGRPDGVFGAQSAAALRNFQGDYGLSPDATCGPATLRALRQLGRKVTGGRPQFLREAAAVASVGPNLLGRRVVIDPGHGGDDTGVSSHGLTEAALVWDLASRIEGRLGVAGVAADLTRGHGTNPSEDERVDFANRTRADLVLSLHIDTSQSALANGVATYHFGTGQGVTSTIGERLAALIQREVVARVGLRDCHTHGRAWDLLRRTRMPAVRLELGYLTHPIDRQVLGDPASRDIIAEAVVVAVQRLYLPAEADPPTGTFRMPAGAFDR